MKLLSVAVPCYNSAEYMSKCIDSLLPGGEDMEIIIVDDGSTDSTPEIAEKYRAAHPDIIRVVHKENGGHGSAVNTGLSNAAGLYFKVVDRDDWVKESALHAVLDYLRQVAGSSPQLDMLVTNYVYNKVGEHRHKVIHYRHSMPADRIFTWDEAKRFRKGHYILMHAVIFRTGLLRECGLKLPEHCFYVDNLYVFEPLPYVKNIRYLDVNFYYYYIGRTDQSVNQEIMISRLDQQIRVNRLMVDYFTSRECRQRTNAHPPLRAYMYNYLEIITTVSSVLALCSYTKEDMKRKSELWEYIRSRDYLLYHRLRYSVFGISMNLPGKGGRDLTVGAYKAARHFFNFN